uniref:Uncharacterized protein n=1 Tax=Pyxicephalus adspersus TaxID=30357 RepID=A0AAV2ZTN8_PYXAD|nr:TPA: hypothetical protein GDO54_002774 [Pyxicephalus adspersus]
MYHLLLVHLRYSEAANYNQTIEPPNNINQTHCKHFLVKGGRISSPSLFYCSLYHIFFISCTGDNVILRTEIEGEFPQEEQPPQRRSNSPPLYQNLQYSRLHLNISKLKSHQST